LTYADANPSDSRTLDPEVVVTFRHRRHSRCCHVILAATCASHRYDVALRLTFMAHLSVARHLNRAATDVVAGRQL